MTNDRKSLPDGRRGPPMNRMMPDTYEKRAMTTAHLRQTLASREGQGAASGPATVKPPVAHSPKPKADG